MVTTGNRSTRVVSNATTTTIKSKLILEMKELITAEVNTLMASRTGTKDQTRTTTVQGTRGTVRTRATIKLLSSLATTMIRAKVVSLKIVGACKPSTTITVRDLAPLKISRGSQWCKTLNLVSKPKASQLPITKWCLLLLSKLVLKRCKQRVVVVIRLKLLMC
jgi:hypothetical protein